MWIEDRGGSPVGARGALLENFEKIQINVIDETKHMKVA